VATQAATARLELDARGFDKQANASFREFSKQLTTVKDGTDAAMRGAEALQKVFIKSLGGVAVIGAANLMADAVRDIGHQLTQAATAAEQANQKLSQLGEIQGIQMGTAAATALQQSLQKTNETLAGMQGNLLQNLVANITGAKDAMSDLAESTQSQIDLTLRLAAAEEARRAKERAGMSDEQRQRAELEASLARENQNLLGQIKDPGQRAAAQASLDQATASKLGDFDATRQNAENLKAAAAATAAQDAARKRSMSDFQLQIDQKSRDVQRQSARDLEKAMEKLRINAQLVELRGERVDLGKEMSAAQAEKALVQSQIQGNSLPASRAGQQALDGARRRQGEANRRDNFQFGQEQVRARQAALNDEAKARANELRALQRVVTEESSAATDRTGKKLTDRIDELQKSGSLDFFGQAKNFTERDALRRIADEQAAREMPSLRDQASTDLAGVESRLQELKDALDQNLKEIQSYSHAGAN